MIHIAPLSKPNEWDRQLEGLVFGPSHTSWFTEIVHQDSGDDCMLFTQDAGRLGRCVIPIRVRRYADSQDLVSTFGNSGPAFCGAPFPGADHFIKTMTSLGFVTAHISLNQVHPGAAYFSELNLITEKPVFRVATSASLDVLWQRFGRNNRRLLKRWNESGSGTLCFDQPRLREALCALYPSFAEERNVGSAYRFTQEQLERLSGNPDHAHLIGVCRPDGSIRFVRLFLYTEHWADAFIEAQDKDGREDSRAVYWAGYKWANEAGIPFLNLSGGITPGDSLEFFKRSLGGDPVSFVRAPIVLRNDIYEAQCQSVHVSTKIDPTGYFPPYYGVGS